jgi:hypothetical protein
MYKQDNEDLVFDLKLSEFMTEEACEYFDLYDKNLIMRVPYKLIHSLILEKEDQ